MSHTQLRPRWNGIIYLLSISYLANHCTCNINETMQLWYELDDEASPYLQCWASSSPSSSPS